MFIVDGNIQRYRLEGDSPSEKSGSYCIYTDRDWPIGWAMDWHVGEKLDWFYKTDVLNQEQKDYLHSKEFKQKVEAAQKNFEAQLKQRHDAAAEKARIHIETLPEASENHAYLQTKHVYPYGVKDNGNGSLVVPIRDINGNIRSLQWITLKGDKKLYPEASTKGCFWSVGMDLLSEHPEFPILLGEGFATMAKVYELTGYPSVAAISCSGLKGVAYALKGKYPNSKIIVMADNDKATEQKSGRNPGIEAAMKLIKLGVSNAVIYPEFSNSEDGTDWDDYAIVYGDEDTVRVLNVKLRTALIPPDVKAILSKMTSINAQELRSKVFPPVKWAVEGFLPEGLSILAGGPKVGKSILVLHLSVGVAIGGCVLGKINVQQGDVLYLALEDTQRRLQDRINGGELCGDETVDLSGLDIVTQIPRQNIGGTVFLEWWLSTHDKARLVIIDTLQMFRKLLTGKGSMYSEDYETISAIKKIADTYGVAILIIHHLKKGMEGDWLSEISGSQGIAGAADTIFSLKRERNSTLATLHRTGRDVEEKDFIMKLDGFSWRLQDNAKISILPEWKRQILTFLKDNPSITAIQLSEVASIPLNTAQQHLRRLTKEGVIKKTGYGTYGLPEE